MLALMLRGVWDGSANEAMDWDLVVQAALAQRVAPLLYDMLHRHDQWALAPRPAAARLQTAYRQTRMENALRVDVLCDALERFSAAGIPAAPLKGAALTEWIYEDAGVRPMKDLDILVPPHEAARAVDILLQAGYRRMVIELRPGFDREFRGELELHAAGQIPYSLELHWRLIDMHWVDRHVDYESLWRRARPAAWRGVPAYRLGPEDWLLHQSAHAVYKHRRTDLLDLCDVDRLVRKSDPPPDWDRLLRIGQGCRWLAGLAQVLGQARAMLDTPIPPSFLSQATAYTPPQPERWLAKAWLSGGLPDSAFPFLDWLTLPDLGARLRFARAYLFPSQDFLRYCYPHAAGWPVLALYGRRFWDRTAGLLARAHTPPSSDD